MIRTKGDAPAGIVGGNGVLSGGAKVMNKEGWNNTGKLVADGWLEAAAVLLERSGREVMEV
ncbi:hypothetical protein LJC56_04430 [Christensenellaceae bacterium OttesenSCG-928-K19]|nr:hypothetical protein [Christensenellaceae bacterium OttesenSCG-928-K19]